MILKFALLHEPSSDVGYLLHKNPSRLHEAEFSFGKGVVAFREIERQTEVALIIDVDAVGLVRGGATYDQYVNDRPYTANSFLSSAMTEFFSTAMSGRSKERQDLADTELPFRFELAVVRARGGEESIRELFEPLGYELNIDHVGAKHFRIEGTFTGLIRDFLSQLYILIPVMDNDKHYYVSRDEVTKLFKRAERWLPTHPSRELISRRYLRYDKILTREAILRLEEFDPEVEEVNVEEPVEKPTKKVTLHTQRLEAAVAKLLETGAQSVADLGCGEGRLLQLLVKQRQFRRILGMDVCLRSLDMAERRLNLKEANERLRERLKLIHGSLMYRDDRLGGYDAAAVVEVIEHMDIPRLEAFERVLFECARPQYVVLTTPNREYNAVFEGMEEDTMRHDDHRFEWTREEFRTWCEKIQSRYGYRFGISGVGPDHEVFGAPSQMAVFNK